MFWKCSPLIFCIIFLRSFSMRVVTQWNIHWPTLNLIVTNTHLFWYMERVSTGYCQVDEVWLGKVSSLVEHGRERYQEFMTLVAIEDTNVCVLRFFFSFFFFIFDARNTSVTFSRRIWSITMPSMYSVCIFNKTDI